MSATETYYYTGKAPDCGGVEAGSVAPPPTPTPPPPTPTPTPDVAAAIADIKLTLDWFHSSKTKGGMGYTVTRTQATNAYKALIALGGTWPA